MHTQMGDGNAERPHPSKDFLEEYFFENAQLGFMEARNHFRRPHQMPKPAKLQTVSIIDTLSELARAGELENNTMHENSAYVSVKDSAHLKVKNVTRRGDKSLEIIGSPRQQNKSFPKRSDTVNIGSFDNVGMSVIDECANKHASKKATAHTVPSLQSSGQRLSSSVSRQSRLERVQALSTTSYPIKAATVRTAKQTDFSRGNTVKSVKSKKNRSQLPFSEKNNRTVNVNPSLPNTCNELSRYCFSDSEIDVLNFSTAKNNSKSIESTKQPLVGCLTVAECEQERVVNRRSWKSSDIFVHNTPPRGIELPLPLQLVEQFHHEFPDKPIKKSDLPPWIRTLFVTAKQGNVEMLKMAMVEMDSALARNLSDRSGNNLWHLCAAYNQLACIKWLCKSYGDDVLKDENKNSQTPAVLAVKFGSLSVVQWLFEHSSNRCITDKFDGNRSLLHYAAKYGQGPVITWLLNVMEKGTDINFVDSYGNTPLHLAAKYGHIQCVKELFLQHGSLTMKNDAGLKAYDLSLCNNQPTCAEYILSLETSYYLSKEHSTLKCEISRFKVESSETKNIVQELLCLLKESLTHQNQLLGFVQNVQLLQQKQENGNSQAVESQRKEEEKIEHFHPELQASLDSEVQRWSSVVTKGDEIAFSNISDKWKRICRRNNLKVTSNKQESVDIIRSQFSKIQSKANYYGAMQETGIASSESSLSDASGDETYSISKRHNLSDKPRKIRQSWLNKTRQRSNSPNLDPVSFMNNMKLKNLDLKGLDRCPINLRELTNKEHSPRAFGLLAHSQLPLSDIDLKELFERNPELKQEGRTCSVIEVLEPSSSENEELSQLNIDLNIKSVSKSEGKVSPIALRQDFEQSDQLEHLSLQACNANSGKYANAKVDFPYSAHENQIGLESLLQQTYSIQKLDVPRITYNATSPNVSMAKILESSKNTNCATTPSAEMDVQSDVAISSVSSSSTNFETKLPRKENLQYSEIQPFDASENLQEASESSKDLESSESGKGQTGGVKKKGFLLKFSLKNRWSSKQKSRSCKKSSESSSEDSKDTSKGSLDNWEASSSPECDLFFPELEIVTAEIGSARDVVDISSENSQVDSKARKLDLPERLLPPPPSITRRDPPPDPPLDSTESDFNASIAVEESSVCLSDIYNSCSLLSEGASSSRNVTDDLNSNEQFCTSSELSRLYSSMGKLDSRPPSSASRIDSSIRIDDTYKGVGFDLGKMSITSTELQVSPGSSTAGRHSPAPSEVSKTESALSPPSDISKTESQCHMKHLSRIEEILKVQNGHDSGCLGNTLINMASLAHQNVQCENVNLPKETLEFEGLPEGQVGEEFRPMAITTTKKRMSTKPWYDVSDEEDILSPDRYHSLKDQSNSEDENGDMLS